MEERALSTFKLRKPKVWFWYVDDVFSITKNTHVPKLLQHLNNQHPSIRFTEELEKDGKLPFSEVYTSRAEDGHVHLSIYRKPTRTSRYLQYASNHTDSGKRSVARALFNRVKHVTREDDKRQEERVKEELLMNNFPQEVIMREKKMARKRNWEKERMQGQKDRDTGTGKESKRTVTIRYIKGMSKVLRAPLGIRATMRSERMKWSVLQRVKNEVDNTEVLGVVYAVGCKECKEVYIGETKRKAHQRIREHKADTRIGRVDKSAIAEHAHVTGHKVHWEVGTNDNWTGTARQTKESEGGLTYPLNEETRRFDEPRQWLAAKQNLAWVILIRPAGRKRTVTRAPSKHLLRSGRGFQLFPFPFGCHFSSCLCDL